MPSECQCARLGGLYATRSKLYNGGKEKYFRRWSRHVVAQPTPKTPMYRGRRADLLRLQGQLQQLPPTPSRYPSGRGRRRTHFVCLYICTGFALRRITSCFDGRFFFSPRCFHQTSTPQAYPSDHYSDSHESGSVEEQSAANQEPEAITRAQGYSSDHHSDSHESDSVEGRSAAEQESETITTPQAYPSDHYSDSHDSGSVEGRGAAEQQPEITTTAQAYSSDHYSNSPESGSAEGRNAAEEQPEPLPVRDEAVIASLEEPRPEIIGVVTSAEETIPESPSAPRLPETDAERSEKGHQTTTVSSAADESTLLTAEASYLGGENRPLDHEDGALPAVASKTEGDETGKVTPSSTSRQNQGKHAEDGTVMEARAPEAMAPIFPPGSVDDESLQYSEDPSQVSSATGKAVIGSDVEARKRENSFETVDTIDGELPGENRDAGDVSGVEGPGGPGTASEDGSVDDGKIQEEEGREDYSGGPSSRAETAPPGKSGLGNGVVDSPRKSDQPSALFTKETKEIPGIHSALGEKNPEALLEANQHPETLALPSEGT